MRITRFLVWTSLLGFALGGFFDGILLHQILQWHHLLSLVPGAGDLRWQVVWDGLFHAGLYAIGAAALIGAWRTSVRLATTSNQEVVGAVLFGFGAWHVVDGVLSHWLLGLHRIRLDSSVPLAWDLGWAAAFGLFPIAAGLLLGRRSRPEPGSSIALVFATAGTLAMGAVSALGPADTPFTTVVFSPRVAPPEAMDALAAADARLVWADATMGVVIVAMPADRRWSLYARGALLVGGAGGVGCATWLTPRRLGV